MLIEANATDVKKNLTQKLLAPDLLILNDLGMKKSPPDRGDIYAPPNSIPIFVSFFNDSFFLLDPSYMDIRLHSIFAPLLKKRAHH